jgi:hypothetical protein
VPPIAELRLGRVERFIELFVVNDIDGGHQQRHPHGLGDRIEQGVERQRFRRKCIRKECGPLERHRFPSRRYLHRNDFETRLTQL